MIVSACVSERRDWFWLRKHSARFDCAISQDEGTAIIGVMGPRSSQLLKAICDQTESVERLGYYESDLLCSGALEFRANRISYVGELGYELYVRSPDAQTLWQRLWEAGATLSIRAAGFHAMNS